MAVTWQDETWNDATAATAATAYLLAALCFVFVFLISRVHDPYRGLSCRAALRGVFRASINATGYFVAVACSAVATGMASHFASSDSDLVAQRFSLVGTGVSACFLVLLGESVRVGQSRPNPRFCANTRALRRQLRWLLPLLALAHSVGQFAHPSLSLAAVVFSAACVLLVVCAVLRMGDDARRVSKCSWATLLIAGAVSNVAAVCVRSFLGQTCSQTQAEQHGCALPRDFNHNAAFYVLLGVAQTFVGAGVLRLPYGFDEEDVVGGAYAQARDDEVWQQRQAINTGSGAASDRADGIDSASSLDTSGAGSGSASAGSAAGINGDHAGIELSPAEAARTSSGGGGAGSVSLDIDTTASGGGGASAGAEDDDGPLPDLDSDGVLRDADGADAGAVGDDGKRAGELQTVSLDDGRR